MKHILVAAIFFMTINKIFAAPKAPATFDLSYAKSIAAKALECAQKKNWKVSIAIVNSESNLMYFERNELAYPGSIEAAIQKAKSSNSFQRPTSAFVERIKQGSVGILSVKGIVALEGGVPILIAGKHVGAIGISGAKASEDEQCAKVAVE